MGFNLNENNSFSTYESYLIDKYYGKETTEFLRKAVEWGNEVDEKMDVFRSIPYSEEKRLSDEIHELNIKISEGFDKIKMRY